jgi:D-tagatose-1,6-bisphosphate aldolase subunit GatZ/KbaZ
MYLDEIVQAQKQGEVKGIPAICSVHPWVLKAAMQQHSGALLIESTCNQVNQYGGYTGMKPGDFVCYLREIAEANNFPFENIILGGDHLGPGVWQNEPAELAMQKAEVMVHDYVRAGFLKIHLDCSMSLADDPAGSLDVEVAATRAARLARVAEKSGDGNLRYVIGTEVPIPGGAQQYEETIRVTRVEDVRQTIEITREAFSRAGLASAWDRVIAVVVQPGVEFGDDFVLPYKPDAAKELSQYIESRSVIYEAHSTDYQQYEGLKNLVHDHFAILKVGPALTFAFREAVFALAMIEEVLFPTIHSKLIQILDEVMLQHPGHWNKYYRGSEHVESFKRKFSFSDRIRYYWPDPRVQAALTTLINNLSEHPLPLSLLSQFAPGQYARIRRGEIVPTPAGVIVDRIRNVLMDYEMACTGVVLTNK